MRRKGFQSLWQRAALSAVIAYALVLQALLVSMTGAAHAAPTGLAQDIICSYDAVSGSHEGPNKAAHDGLCCILGCTGAHASAGLAPETTVKAAASALSVAVEPVVGQAPLRLSAGFLPVGSRAPPRLD